MATQGLQAISSCSSVGSRALSPEKAARTSQQHSVQPCTSQKGESSDPGCLAWTSKALLSPAIQVQGVAAAPQQRLSGMPQMQVPLLQAAQGGPGCPHAGCCSVVMSAPPLKRPLSPQPAVALLMSSTYLSMLIVHDRWLSTRSPPIVGLQCHLHRGVPRQE